MPRAPAQKSAAPAEPPAQKAAAPAPAAKAARVSKPTAEKHASPPPVTASAPAPKGKLAKAAPAPSPPAAPEAEKRARRTAKADGGDVGKADKAERMFTVFSSSIGHLGGRFISKNPGSAAGKAGNRQFRKMDAWGVAAPKTNAAGNPVIEFALRENGDKSKVRRYEVTRENKPNPDVVTRVIKGEGGKPDKTIEIEHKYKYVVQPLGEMSAEDIAEISAERSKRKPRAPRAAPAPPAPPAPEPPKSPAQTRGRKATKA